MSNARPADIFNLCQFQFANGRLCGLPAHPKGDGYCLTHARARYAAENPPQREDDLSAELRSPAGDFITQIDINTVLGKLFDALAANRLSPRRASSLAYIAFLLLQSQQGAKKEAMRWAVDLPVFEKMLKLKYPIGHPNRPKDRPKPSQRKGGAITIRFPYNRFANFHSRRFSNLRLHPRACHHFYLLATSWADLAVSSRYPLPLSTFPPHARVQHRLS